MDYSLIGKIQKAKEYAEDPSRVTFNSFTVEFRGDNDTYIISLGPDGWQSSDRGFQTYGISPQVMSMERMFGPMLKREPLPYASGQNVVSANADTGGQPLQIVDRVRLPDIEKPEQEEPGQNVAPVKAEGDEQENDQLAHHLVNDGVGRVFIAEKLGRTAGRPYPGEAEKQ